MPKLKTETNASPILLSSTISSLLSFKKNYKQSFNPLSNTDIYSFIISSSIILLTQLHLSSNDSMKKNNTIRTWLVKTGCLNFLAIKQYKSFKKAQYSYIKKECSFFIPDRNTFKN